MWQRMGFAGLLRMGVRVLGAQFLRCPIQCFALLGQEQYCMADTTGLKDSSETRFGVGLYSVPFPVIMWIVGVRLPAFDAVG